MFFPRADWGEGLQNFVTPVQSPQGGPRVGAARLPGRRSIPLRPKPGGSQDGSGLHSPHVNPA